MRSAGSDLKAKIVVEKSGSARPERLSVKPHRGELKLNE
jgi:hypothetical protein